MVVSTVVFDNGILSVFSPGVVVVTSGTFPR